MKTRYRPGSSYLAVRPGRLVLLDAAVDPTLVDDMWTVLTSGGGVVEVLQLLTTAFGATISAIPPFAIVAETPTGVQLAVRGGFVVTGWDDEGAAERIDASHAVSWREGHLADPAQIAVTVADGPVASPDLPIEIGIALAADAAIDRRDRASSTQSALEAPVIADESSFLAGLDAALWDGAASDGDGASALHAAERPCSDSHETQTIALGRLVFSTGQIVALDREIVIGRRPQATTGAPIVPRLVSVPSPGQDISRSHLIVRVDEGDIVVRDTSTNGTTLHRVGSPPRLIEPSEECTPLDGDVLELGEGVTVTVERSP